MLQIELVVVLIHSDWHEALVEVTCELVILLIAKIQLSAKIVSVT